VQTIRESKTYPCHEAFGLGSTELEYPSGSFSIGVRSVIVQQERVLLVKINYGHRGWMLPGGYVRPQESIGEAIRREVREETGLIVEPLELVSVRSRIKDGKNDIYVTFMVKATGGELKPDGKEIEDAKYFSLEEMQGRSDIPKLFPHILSQILKPKTCFTLSDFKPASEEKYELWI